MKPSFSSEERAALSRLLADQTLQKALDVVLMEIEGPIFDLRAPEQLTKLAIEKGARDFVRRLRKLGEPDAESRGHEPIRAKSLHPPKKTDAKS